jgi:hypothetical protein
MSKVTNIESAVKAGKLSVSQKREKLHNALELLNQVKASEAEDLKRLQHYKKVLADALSNPHSHTNQKV